MIEAKAVYIHIPFCRHICYYCDFCRQVYQENLASQYLISLQTEIKAVLSDTARYKSIYIGGGTPSSLSVSQLTYLFETIKPYQQDDIEYTMECNPEDLIAEKIILFQQYGINRISIGVQSASERLLQSVNRNHTLKLVQEGVDRLKSFGIHNISVDLIYGLPMQSMTDWKDTLQKIVQLNIQHISLYSLTIEENSVFGKRNIQKIEDDLEADMYEFAIEFLTQKNFKQYEISNFCKENFTSKHNLTYWRYDDFIGLGVGASGKAEHYRYTNTSSLKAYIKDYRNKEYIHLDTSQQMFEYIMMNLRTINGISLSHFEENFKCSFLEVFFQEIEVLKEKNLVEVEKEYFRVSKKGLIVLNDVLLEFLLR